MARSEIDGGQKIRNAAKNRTLNSTPEVSLGLATAVNRRLRATRRAIHPCAVIQSHARICLRDLRKAKDRVLTCWPRHRNLGLSLRRGCRAPLRSWCSSGAPPGEKRRTRQENCPLVRHPV